MKILAVVAHPDDELLGPGGALLKHAHAGDKIYIHILTNGHTSRINHDDRKKVSDAELNRRIAAAKKVAVKIGVSDFLLDNFADQKLDTYPHLEIVKAIEKFSERISPDIIYTHFGGDLNKDHRVTYSAVLTAFRPVKLKNPFKILSFETVSSTEWGILGFSPNYFIDISDFLNRKIELLSFYKSELKNPPHALSKDNILYTARKWGASIHSNAAEAFVLLREIWR